jgi:hypothetical protein
MHRQNQTFEKKMKIKLVAIGEYPKKSLITINFEWIPLVPIKINGLLH